ncbi:putative structural protein [Sphingomonas phage Kimi]|nr:putative structural protein [Sphingomonas phage Kimi]
MPNVGFVREDMRPRIREYDKIRDCLAGSDAVKAKGTRYLPNPEPDPDGDKKGPAAKRYNDYLTRAVFYNVTERTQMGLVGQVFLRDPLVEVPALLQPVIDDATGSGVPLQQLANQSCGYAIGYGRLGLFVDYPATNQAADEGQEDVRPASRAEIEAGDIRPTIAVVAPWDGINYRVIKKGAKIILSLVVFREDRIYQDDGFEQKVRDQFRVLRLDETGHYVNEVYYNKQGVQPDEQYFPVDANGNRLTEIPFTFVGSVNNDPTPDKPPLLDMTELNLAHYRNSADYEESVFITGQPTPVLSGLTEEWVTKVLGGKVRLGARGAVALPIGGDAKLLQADPNTLAKEAMDQKEAQMLALGAKLVEGSQVQRTATEADIDNVSETSVLSTVAKNVGAGFKWALEWAAVFVGASEAGIAYELNTEFDLVNMTPEERKALLAEWQAGAISFTEVRDNLRRAGVASLDDKTAKTEIEQEMQTAVDRELAEQEERARIAAENNPNPNPGNE